MKISLEKAKSNKLFYVVTNGIIYHPKLKKCLILQRSFKEKAHPGLWGVVGGKMEWGDMESNQPTRQNHAIPDWEGLVEQSLRREAKEESGLETEDPKYLFSIVFLRPDNVPVVCFKFALKYKSGEVKIPPEFEDFAWVDGEEVKGYEIIQGIDKEVEETINLYSTNSI
jgi:8-oxo-dGTP pyrophosphatase MutT (NUDIX family)